MAMDTLSIATTLIFPLVLILFLVHRRLRGAPHLPLPPGPRGWPLIGSLPLLRPLPHTALAALAKRYGPIMYLKLGTCGFAVASSPAVARAFLHTLDVQFADRPINAAARYVGYDGEDLVWAGYGAHWKLLRKLSSVHLLGPGAVSQWAFARRSEVDRMIRSIVDMSRRSEPVRLHGMVMGGLANMLGLAILSRRVFESDGAELSEFKKKVLEVMELSALANVADFIPSLKWLDPQGIERRVKSLHESFDALMTRMLREHAETASQREGRQDFVDHLVANGKTSDGGKTLSEVNIKGLIVDMFIAGTDTSSITIEWAFTELLSNPSILKRAQLEMDEVIGRDRRLEESDLPKLTYLQAICKEVLRKHATTPLNLPHLATQDCEIDGYYIPAGTRLLVNIYAIGRDPDVWENPLEFNPERFLSGKSAKIDVKGTDFELMPFGAGRRICAGKYLGMLFVQSILGSLIHAFDWAVPDGQKIDMEESAGLALQKTNPIIALATPRLSPSAYL